MIYVLQMRKQKSNTLVRHAPQTKESYEIVKTTSLTITLRQKPLILGLSRQRSAQPRQHGILKLLTSIINVSLLIKQASFQSLVELMIRTKYLQRFLVRLLKDMSIIVMQGYGQMFMILRQRFLKL